MPGLVDVSRTDQNEGNLKGPIAHQLFVAYLLHKGIHTGHVARRSNSAVDVNKAVTFRIGDVDTAVNRRCLAACWSPRSAATDDSTSCSRKASPLKHVEKGSPSKKWYNDRLKTEYLAPEQLDPAFATKKHAALEVIHNGEATAVPREVSETIPDAPGIYLVCAKPPRASDWVPVYWGQTRHSLRRRIMLCYVKSLAGTFGPAQDYPEAYISFLDMQRRGFSFQLRFKVTDGSDAEKRERLDTWFDFPLKCHKPDGSVSTRQVELPGTVPYSQYPPVKRHITTVYKNAKARLAAKQRPASA